MKTTLIIDGSPHDIDVIEDWTLLDLLIAAQEQFWTDEHNINSLTIDGKDADLTQDILGVTPFKGQKISINLGKNETGRSLGDTVKEAIDYASRLAAGFKDLADGFRTKEDRGQFVQLKDGFGGLIDLLTLLDFFTTKAQVDSETRRVIRQQVRSLRDLTEEMTQAQEANDLILVSDLLEYELAPATVDLATVLQKVLTQITT